MVIQNYTTRINPLLTYPPPKGRTSKYPLYRTYLVVTQTVQTDFLSAKCESSTHSVTQKIAQRTVTTASPRSLAGCVSCTTNRTLLSANFDRPNDFMNQMVFQSPTRGQSADTNTFAITSSDAHQIKRTRFWSGACARYPKFQPVRLMHIHTHSRPGCVWNGKCGEILANGQILDAGSLSGEVPEKTRSLLDNKFFFFCSIHDDVCDLFYL